MKNTFGNNLTVTLFGESHGPAVGCVLDGLTPGLPVDEAVIAHYLTLRRPAGDISTARREADEFVIESGVYEGHTTGAPVCILIPNRDTRSADYAAIRHLPRPSHADYTAHVKYGGCHDPRGGGHFSGRVTAALVAAGALVMPALNARGIRIGTHIKQIGAAFDRDFADLPAELTALYDKPFAALDDVAGARMRAEILAAKEAGDSVGGVLETAVCGVAPGLGDPFFDSVESRLSHALFSIPGIKGVEFGCGFGLAAMRGSEANDPLRAEGGRIVTVTNHAGGINGGITNGMPILFRCAVRPTPTIAREQLTVDLQTGENAVIAAAGRHDPCIVHRVRAVVDCVAALTLSDLLLGG